jgi:pyridoxamine 5'-phosphate oxidase
VSGHHGRDYHRRVPFLEPHDLDADPLRQAQLWLEDAEAADLLQPRAMAVATATPDGAPSVRTVLLRGLDARGFVFFTNRESRKGEELAANPRAAIALYWDRLERQLRAEGRVELVDRAESEAYYATRPPGSRIAALASPQSRVVHDRAALDNLFADAAARFATDDEIPLPEFWGGYRVVPDSVEFWQGQPDRLHDRLRYERLPTGGWRVDRLAP